MARPIPPAQPAEGRVRHFREVSLAFSKKIAQEEARRCPQCATATCLPGCPLGIDIPGFIRLLREGDTASALERIRKENPFPAICGRICPAPCEQACVFNADGEPIAIRDLERFAADSGPKAAVPKMQTAPAKKVAVIGSGPAGMSAAYYLARANVGVTVFEAAHQPGGLLRYGIPELRLPQKVLDEQLAMLNGLGVEIQTDIIFGRTLLLDEIFMRGFAALVLATGGSLPRFSDLPGNNLAGVYYDTEFLSRLQNVYKEGVLQAAKEQSIPPMKTVVIGRGAAAFDCARLSARLGHEVSIIFEGFEEQAGVEDDILKQSKDEGIKVHSLKPLEIIAGGDGFVRGVRCRALEIIEDKDGLRLEPSSQEPAVMEAQTVIIADGHQPGAAFKDLQGRLNGMDNVFSCGGLSVVEAIASGKKTAQTIIQYLS